MNRPIAIVGAPSSIGIRPYDSGEPRGVDRAPAVLRELRVIERLGAVDLGDVVPPAYWDYVRPPRRARNEREVAAYCASLGERVALAAEQRRFVVLLGGDCSIVLAGLLGARCATGGAVGLAYVDAHADFATPDQSQNGFGGQHVPGSRRRARRDAAGSARRRRTLGQGCGRRALGSS